MAFNFGNIPNFFTDLKNLLSPSSTGRQRVGGAIGAFASPLLPDLGVSEAVSQLTPTASASDTRPASSQPFFDQFNQLQTAGQQALAQAPTGETAPAPTGTAPTGDIEDIISGPSEEEIAGVFNPLFSALDLEEGKLGPRRDLSLSEAEASRQRQESGIGTREGDFLTTLSEQEGQIGKAKESAISSARRVFNELGQQSRARFGGRSSVGGALSEIIGRSTAEQIGGANIASQEGFNQLLGERVRLARQVDTAKSELQTRFENLQQQINLQFNEQMADIGKLRFETESAKQAAQLDAQTNLQDKIQQLQIDLLKESFNIQNAEAQGQELINQQLANIGISPTSLTQRLEQIQQPSNLSLQAPAPTADKLSGGINFGQTEDEDSLFNV